MALIAAVLVFLVLQKYPAALIPPLIFAGEFKMIRGGIDRLSLADLTLLAALLLGTAILLRILLDLAGENATFLKDAVASWKGIALFLGLAALISLSILYTPAPAYGMEKLVRFLGICSLLFFAPIILIRKERDLRIFAIVLLVLATTLSIKTVYGIFHPKEVVNSLNEIVTDVTEIGAGQLAGMAILIAVCYRPPASKPVRWLAILCLPLLVAGLAAADARGPILSLALVLALSSIFLRRRQSRKTQSLVALCILGMLLGGLVFVLRRTPGEARDTMDSKIAELSDLAGGRNPGGSAGKRLDYYGEAPIAIREKPLLGWGIGGWSKFYFHEDRRGYPHNLFLEVGVEEGSAGLFILLAFVARIFWVAAKTRGAGDGRFSFILPVLAFSLLVTMFSGDITDNRSFWMWCGLSLALSRLAGVADMEPVSAQNWQTSNVQMHG